MPFIGAWPATLDGWAIADQCSPGDLLNALAAITYTKSGRTMKKQSEKKEKKKPWRKQDDPLYQKASDIAARSMDFSRFRDEDEALEHYRELKRDIYDDLMFRERY